MEAARPAVRYWSMIEEVVSLLLTIREFAPLDHHHRGPEPFPDDGAGPSVRG